MLIKFIQRWRRWRIGDLYDYADGAAQLLIHRGIAEKVAVEEVREPECMMLAGGETMDPPQPKPRKRGRPRKVKVT